MKIPHIIGLCGNPHSGKTEVQKILENYGAISVDDGRPMRQFAVDWLGLSWDDVLTVAGKKGFTMIAGQLWNNRDVLGQIGNKLEELFGPNGIPHMATRNLDSAKSYCFGSVRRQQGHFYRQRGGLVLGVRREAAAPSPFEFDRFDETAVHFWIENNGSLTDLRISVLQALYHAFDAGLTNH